MLKTKGIIIIIGISFIFIATTLADILRPNYSMADIKHSEYSTQGWRQTFEREREFKQYFSLNSRYELDLDITWDSNGSSIRLIEIDFTTHINEIKTDSCKYGIELSSGQGSDHITMKIPKYICTQEKNKVKLVVDIASSSSVNPEMTLLEFTNIQLL